MKKLLIIFVLIFLSGCQCFQDNRVRIPPGNKFAKTSPEYRAMVMFLFNLGKGWTAKEYTAEIEYLRYLDSQK